MMELIFATNNQHKIDEIQAVCPPHITILGLKQAGIDIEIEEPFDTFEENAHAKCKAIVELTGKPCFSEDSGLLIDALNGEPGVHSARYAGEHGNHAKNIEKVLHKLTGEKNRTAHFKTVICLYLFNEYQYFEGQCHGTITEQLRGVNGFGYDPIFVPNGYQETFAELPNSLKVTISHRKKAFDKLVISLNQCSKA